MMCKDRLISLLNELIQLFEDGNRLIYKRCIVLRHILRNRYSEEYIQNECKLFWIKNKSLIDSHDITAFKHSLFYNDVQLIWSETSPKNRILIWQWIESISKDFKF